MRTVSRDVVERAFDLDTQLRNVDAIFDRVFGGEPAGLKTGRSIAVGAAGH
jgi:hypothetical protein